VERIKRALLAFILFCVSAAPALATPDPQDGAAGGAAWLASQQRAGGDLTSFSGSSVADLIVALLAGGEVGEPVDRALAYIRSKGASITGGSAAKAGRVVMGLVAAGENPRSFGGIDYVKLIGNDEATGRYEDNVYANALAILGLGAARADVPDRAVTYMRAQQCVNGGFSWQQGCAGTPDVDTTVMATSGLLAAGVPRSDNAISRARSFFVDAQNPDGGFGLEDSDETNANSTGLALSAIAALGESSWAPDPSPALQRLQTPGGGFKYMAGNDEPGVYATVQAVPGLAGVVYPMGRVDRSASDVRRAPGAASATNRPEPGAETTQAPKRSTSRAGLIVDTGEGEPSRECVGFDEPTITGQEMLVRSQVKAVVSRSEVGTSICSLDGKGCGSGDCFCRYPAFWGYWTLDPGQKGWRFSDVGASARNIRDGSVDAWVWGKDGKPAPPVTTADEVCSAVSTGRDPDVSAEATAPDAGDATSAAPLVGFAVAALVLAAAGAFFVLRRRRTA
jgi:hypothetical protein